jgi:hypothetical protein
LACLGTFYIQSKLDAAASDFHGPAAIQLDFERAVEILTKRDGNNDFHRLGVTRNVILLRATRVDGMRRRFIRYHFPRPSPPRYSREPYNTAAELFTGRRRNVVFLTVRQQQ